MGDRLIAYFYPDLLPEEIKKFRILSWIFFIIIGTYWLLRLLKKSIFYKLAFPEQFGWMLDQGRLFEPIAKLWSPFVVALLVLIYSKLVDSYKKEHLFYIICSFYTLIFGSITTVLFARSVFGNVFLGKTVLALTGWLSYFFVESFGSLVVVLFWSFTNSITTTESAKRGYPLVFIGAQCGAILGSVLNFFAHKLGGIGVLFLVGTLGIASIIPLIRYFVTTVSPEQQIGNPQAAQTQETKTGFFAGLQLLFTRPYLMGVLVVSTIYEVVTFIIEYQMQTLASMLYTSELAFAQFQGLYGIATNALSFTMALLGLRYLIKRFGTQLCLLIFPICLALAITLLFLFYRTYNPTEAQLLWATFAVFMSAKGLGYAVNNPIKEILYIPTSKDAQFKTKGWIDTFGSRTAKQSGAGIANAFKHNMNDLMLYGLLISCGIISFWLLVAYLVGKKNIQLIQERKIIE